MQADYGTTKSIAIMRNLLLATSPKPVAVLRGSQGARYCDSSAAPPPSVAPYKIGSKVSKVP